MAEARGIPGYDFGGERRRGRRSGQRTWIC